MKKVLILGAYGLIGAACVTALKPHGFAIVGMGRSEEAAGRSASDIDWIIADISSLSIEQWQRHLTGVDVVINAAGALQDGARDNLHAIHDASIANLCAAARGTGLRFVQISAAGAAKDAPTEFFRSKARGDAHIQTSSLDWIILRPTLVIGSNAFGGTALLRGVAGVPAIGVDVFKDSPVQTISLDELAEAVAKCVLGQVPAGKVYDLTEPESRRFGETVSMVRNWLGFPSPIWHVPVPQFVIRICGRMADALGWLGWRSPMRSTSMRTLSEGVTGDPMGWRDAGMVDFSPLSETLAKMPATLQERWFARLYLLLPLSVAILSLFWLISGLIGLLRFEAAVDILTERGFRPRTAQVSVLLGSIADMLLGMLVLYRPWAKRACLGMVLLSLGYMTGATLFAADLWLDPLGPMVKVLPSIGLALLVYTMLEER